MAQGTTPRRGWPPASLRARPPPPDATPRTGEVKEEEAAGKTLRRRQGRFAYSTSLPADADTEKIDAQLADGILTVRLLKAAQARSRRIEIKD